MILGPTIEHLRTDCPPFAGRVAGAADFKQGLEKYNATMPLPAAYVLPAEQDGEDGNENMVGYFQIVKQNDRGRRRARRDRRPPRPDARHEV